MTNSKLPQSFYARSARTVAQALLGKKLVRQLNGRLLSGIIVETEAYCDAEERDLACHGERVNDAQPTPRTAVMFGPAGFAYVYFTYGIHWLFNVVTGQEGRPNAVLVRALEPVDGTALMTEHRGERPFTQLTNGPAKLTQALRIDKSHNGANLCQPDGVIWIEDAPAVPPNQIAVGPRIGLGKTPEPWYSIPWRYWLADNPFVSK
ncbi:MAG: 3-methyladenine DNA glycosylase [Anaerolineaceae bacterium]|nr:3-methyladenine DNA glycosylase [Anaerolineaceae bacterium]